MRLFIMRHGPAEADAASGRDFDRALSARGRVRTVAVAEELARRGQVPARIFASPLVRARETAEIVATTLGCGEPETREELAPSEDGQGLVRELLRCSTTSALLVGHAPDVSLLTGSLLGSHMGSFDAAMVVVLEVNEHGGIREFVIRPEALGV